MFKFELGSKVVDEVSGFAGTVTGQYKTINGKVRYQVEALVNGNLQENWFDEARLQVAKRTAKKSVK